MSRNALGGAFDPHDLRDHLSLIDAMGVIPPGDLFDFLMRVRTAELSSLEREPIWQDMVASTQAEMAAFLHLTAGEAHDLAVSHVRAMLGENLIWPTYISAYLSRPEVFRPQIRVWGQESLDGALRSGRGAVLAQCHWGAFQMLLPALLIHGYSVFQFFGDAEAAAWASDVIRDRNPGLFSHMETLVVPDPAVARRSLQTIDRGFLVAIPPEISEGTTKPKLHTEFLGVEVYAPEGPAFLAATARVPLIPVRVQAEGPTLHCYLGEPIEVTKSRSGIQEAVQRCFRDLEKAVRTTPHQWRGWGFLRDMCVAATVGEVKR